MIHNKELLTAIILFSIAISIFIIKYIEIHSISFIGRKSRKFIVLHKVLSIVQQIIIEISLILLSHYKRIMSVVSIPYMFIALYIIIQSIIAIRLLIIEDEQGTNIISHIVKVVIKETKIGIPKIKILLYNNKKIEFKVTHVDTKRINSLLKEQSVVSKIHYYESSERLYGLELLRYQKI